jgi:hypothetical protein
MPCSPERNSVSINRIRLREAKHLMTFRRRIQIILTEFLSLFKSL